MSHSLDLPAASVPAGARTMSRSLPRALAVALAIVVLLAAMLTLFAWPAVESRPRDLPIGFAGPSFASGMVKQALETAQPGGFKLTTYADAAAADAAIRARQIYAALVMTPGGRELHVASAASPAVAQALGQMVGHLPAAPGMSAAVTVVDVVPAAKGDPRGVALISGILPMLISGIILGALLTVAFVGAAPRLLALAVFAVVAGPVAATVLGPWLDALGGDFWLVSASLGLLVLAVAAPIAGLGALIGLPGIPLAILVVFLIGNPLSGLSSAPEFLPQPWGLVGQCGRTLGFEVGGKRRDRPGTCGIVADFRDFDARGRCLNPEAD